MKKINKKFLIIGLCFVLIFMGTTYSLLFKELKVSSKANIVGEFKVKILSINSNEHGNAVSKNIVINDDGVSASFTTDLFNSSDYVEYEVVVKNVGNINAILDDYSVSSENTTPYIDISYQGLEKNKKLKVGESLTFIIKISVNGNNDDLEDSEGTVYNMVLDYIQES